MTQPRFLQIHSLCSYPGALLNRDDTGMAKRLPFGGTMRTRISSQCLKRHWRYAGTDSHDAASRVPYSLQSLGLPMGERSREIFDRVLWPRAVQGLAPVPDAVRAEVGDAVLRVLYGDKGSDPKARQALFFGHPEIDYLVTVVRGLVEQVGDFAPFVVDDRKAADKAAKALGATLKEELKPLRDNLRALALGAGLESALFGRMVTSDPSSNKDAPVHVAHAFTVHAQERELDFVTVIDDLLRLDDAAGPGSAGMFDADLTSGLYYGYVNIDVELLMANLQGDASVAARVAAQLVQLIARVSPGAKKGSTAPFAHAEWVMVEAGDDQPRTLANAFRKAVPLKSESDVYAEAMTSLQGHLNQLDRAYGVGARRAQLCVTEPALNDVPRHDIAGLGAWIGSELRASAS